MPGIDVLAQLGADRWIVTDAARLQHTLQRARFDLMGVASRRALAGDITGGNAEVRALLDAVPQMRGWVVVNPSYPALSAEELRRHVGGPKWFGAMLHPRLCRQRLASGATREVLNAYRRYTKPILVDVPDEHAVHDLEILAGEFSTIKFVAANAGGDDWQDCMLLAKRQVNVFLEPFSGGAHRGKVEAMLATVGPHRIVYGSNFPEQNPGAALGLLMEAKMTDAERQAILTTNATRLFGVTREG